MVFADDFLHDLRREVEAHPTLHHPFLKRSAAWPWTREDYKVLSLQHYPLVGLFTWYMERLKERAPHAQARSWLERVLVDEYGEQHAGQDHASLYRQFMTCCGVAPGEEDQVVLDRRVVRFVREHARMVTQEPFLVGLGALGPGHEWSIPTMFGYLLEGLERTFAPEEIHYFTLHVKQDQDHGAWLEEALREIIRTPEDAAQVRRGTLLSLEARARFWEGVQERVVLWRQPPTGQALLDALRSLMARRSVLPERGARTPTSFELAHRPQLRAWLGVS